LTTRFGVARVIISVATRIDPTRMLIVEAIARLADLALIARSNEHLIMTVTLLRRSFRDKNDAQIELISINVRDTVRASYLPIKTRKNSTTVV
jgi:hypothetical protein